MKKNGKKSFFEKLTGAVNLPEDDFEREISGEEIMHIEGGKGWMEEENEEGQLTIDVYQTPDDIIVQTMVAGVRPENLDVTIARDMVTVKGKRERESRVSEEDYFYNELYWGTFSRTVLLPQEVDPELAEATERNGLLTLKLPKIDREKKRNVRVKSA